MASPWDGGGVRASLVGHGRSSAHVGGGRMPKARQISAWVVDRPGVLGEVANALAEKGIGIRAFMAAAMDWRAFVRVVVDRPAAALRIFAAHGWLTAEDDVIEVTVRDRPGALGAVADRLGKAGVNIQYADLGRAGSARDVNLYLAVGDASAGLRALRRGSPAGARITPAAPRREARASSTRWRPARPRRPRSTTGPAARPRAGTSRSG